MRHIRDFNHKVLRNTNSHCHNILLTGSFRNSFDIQYLIAKNHCTSDETKGGHDNLCRTSHAEATFSFILVSLPEKVTSNCIRIKSITTSTINKSCRNDKDFERSYSAFIFCQTKSRHLFFISPAKLNLR